jgi:hypothetical protein
MNKLQNDRHPYSVAKRVLQTLSLSRMSEWLFSERDFELTSLDNEDILSLKEFEATPINSLEREATDQPLFC